MKTLVSIDPGVSSGIAVGTYSDTEPYRLVKAFQVEGGLTGILKNLRLIEEDFGEWGVLRVGPLTGESISVDLWDTEDNPDWDPDGEEMNFEVTSHTGTVIAEKFTPRSGGGFSHTQASTEPLRIEGALIALGVLPDYRIGKSNPRWQQPKEMYFAGGEDLSTRKKRAHAWLKNHDLYVTGKDVGCKDANDARSAMLHAIAYLRKQKHLPTLEHYFKGS